MFNYENHCAACFTHISGDDRSLSTETPEDFSKPLPGIAMQTFSTFRWIYCVSMKVLFFIIEIAVIIITLGHHYYH